MFWRKKSAKAYSDTTLDKIGIACLREENACLKQEVEQLNDCLATERDRAECTAIDHADQVKLLEAKVTLLRMELQETMNLWAEHA